MAKHHGLYDESPSIKHEEGKAKVVKTPKSEHGDGPVEKGVEGEGYPVHAKHLMERHMMYAKHEHEHAIHDAYKGGKGHEGKEEMHNRHQKEMKEMHTRHEKELGAHGGKQAGAGGATGEPIEKVEKNAKG